MSGATLHAAKLIEDLASATIEKAQRRWNHAKAPFAFYALSLAATGWRSDVTLVHAVEALVRSADLATGALARTCAARQSNPEAVFAAREDAVDLLARLAAVPGAPNEIEVLLELAIANADDAVYDEVVRWIESHRAETRVRRWLAKIRDQFTEMSVLESEVT